MRGFSFLIVLLVIVALSDGLVQKKKAHKAKLISCARCKLQKLDDVRNFIQQDLGLYEQTEWLRIPGKKNDGLPCELDQMI